jgi:hypothetical protein
MTDIFGTVHRMAEQLRFDAVTVFIFKWLKGYKKSDINGDEIFHFFGHIRNEEQLKVEPGDLSLRR